MNQKTAQKLLLAEVSLSLTALGVGTLGGLLGLSGLSSVCSSAMMYGGFAVLAVFAAENVHRTIGFLWQKAAGCDGNLCIIPAGLAGLTVLGVAAVAFVTSAEVAAAHMIASAVAAGVTAGAEYNSR